MKAEYNKWYKCQDGQMPEDFENIKRDQDLAKYYSFITERVNVWVKDAHLGYERVTMTSRCKTPKRETNWLDYYNQEVIAWMLPEPYKED